MGFQLPNRNIFDGTKSPAPTVADMKGALGTLRDFLSDLLGTDSGNKAASRAALGVAPASRTGGLVGTNNATTPLTKYDLSADVVVLRDANGATVAQYNTGTKTCDLGLAGSAANGRDQSAAFSANSWIYLYYIYNPTTLTLATLASLTAPASFTGSTLPAGYTFWAFATALRWNGSSQLYRTRAKGRKVWYEIDNGGANRLVNAGTATSFTTVTLSSMVPPVALFAVLRPIVGVIHSVAGASFGLFMRPTGSVMTTGTPYAEAVIANAASYGSDYGGEVEIPMNASQQIDYRLTQTVDTSGGAYLDVMGYVIPNGGE